jgi:hypothetical protein
MRTLAVLLSLGVLSACGGDGARPGDDQRACTAIATAGIVVQFFDAANNAAITAIASGTLTEGSYAEPMNANNTQPVSQISGAFNRPGTYNVVVAASRTSTTPQQNFTFNNAVVRRSADGCSVDTVFLRASLQ